MSEDAPILVAIILCDMVIVDEATKKRSLIGMFNSINVNSLPVNYPKMILFFSFTNWKGKKNIAIRVKDPLGNIAFEGEIEYSHPDPVGLLEFTTNIDSFPLFHQGVYDIDVLVGGTPMGQRQFEVKKDSLTPMKMPQKK